MAPARRSTGANGGRTAWARNLATPVRDFLGTETGSALVLVGAVVVALALGERQLRQLLANCGTPTSRSRSARTGSTTSLREWVNEGLMTLFFLVVGLEAKREIDLGELREHNRLWYPALAALGGIARRGRHLPALQRGRAGRRRLGRRDVDRHGAGARRPRPGRADRLHPPARLPPHPRRLRRPRRAGDHRHRLHRLDRRRRARRSRSASSRCWGCCASCRRCAGRSRSWSASRSGWRCTSRGSTR